MKETRTRVYTLIAIDMQRCLINALYKRILFKPKFTYDTLLGRASSVCVMLDWVNKAAIGLWLRLWWSIRCDSVKLFSNMSFDSQSAELGFSPISRGGILFYFSLFSIFFISLSLWMNTLWPIYVILFSCAYIQKRIALL